MKVDEMKKGTWVLLRNGWHGELWDNKRGTIRVANVYGDYTEAGSIYAHDIIAYAEKPVNGDSVEYRISFKWKTDVEYSPSQKQCRESVMVLGW